MVLKWTLIQRKEATQMFFFMHIRNSVHKSPLQHLTKLNSVEGTAYLVCMVNFAK